jgi:predicted DNA-binding protein YlxM (UPF0122 family)
MDAKKQNSMICARGKHLRHEFNLFKNLQTETWAVECKNCQGEHSYIKNEIGKSGMTLEFIELQNLYDNQKDKKFVYLIVIDEQVYPGKSTQPFGQRFEKEVRDAYARDTQGHRKSSYFYPISEAIRNKLDLDENNLPPMSEIIKKAKAEIDLVLWQICETDIEMNNAERFWIGATKSQFKGYGYSITAGGEGGGQTTRIIPEVFLDEALQEGFKYNYKSLMNFLVDYLNDNGNKDAFIKSSLIYTVEDIDFVFTPHVIRNSIREYFDGKTFQTFKNERRNEKLLLNFEQGLSLSEIAQKFGVKDERVRFWMESLVKQNDLKRENVIMARTFREIFTKGEFDWDDINNELKMFNNLDTEQEFFEIIQNTEIQGEIRLAIDAIIKELKENKVSLEEIEVNLQIFKDLYKIEKSLNLRIKDFYFNLLNVQFL